MSDILEVLAVLGVVCGAMLLTVFSLVAGIDYLDCRGFQSGTGIETRWEWGCYANVNGQWVPKQYAFGDAHELRIKERAK